MLTPVAEPERLDDAASLCCKVCSLGRDLNFTHAPFYRRQMPQAVAYLIQLGADVNAVAKDDTMPLTLAFAAADSDQKEEIIAALKAK